MLKRTISLLLVLVMVISMLPARAVAAGYQTALDRAADFGDGLEAILEQSVEAEATYVPEETTQQIVPEALPEPEPEIILMDTEGDYTYTVSSDNTATITGYSGTDTELEIPDTLGGYPVTGIGDEVFYGCSNLTSAIIPNGITKIGYHAFYNCDGLTEVTIPSSVTSFGPKLFENCDNLEHIEFAEGITAIGQESFMNISGLQTVTIPEGVTSIGYHAFQNCDGLAKVTIPASLTSAGSKVFEGCDSLVKIVLAEGSTVIPTGMYCNLTTDFEIVIPSTVTSINQEAFAYCIGMSSIELPEGITSIGYHAFHNCDSLTEIKIPASVTSFGSKLFENCDNLAHIEFAEGITAIGKESFVNIPGLRSAHIPDSVISIEYRAFHNCPNLEISCSPDSYALEYALKNDLFVSINNWTRPESDILNMDAAYYNTNSSNVNTSGYIDLVVHYELKEEQVEELSDMKLRVLLQSKLVLMENSLRLNGEVPREYSYKDNVLTVPVTEASGTLRFSVNPESAARLFSRAEFVYTKDGVTDSDIIDCINSDMPVLTLVTNATVNTADIRVSGIAPAEAVLTFFIDNVEAGTTTASKAGNYSAELTIPDPEEGRTYTVKAVAAVGDTTVEKTMSVTYDLASPVLEELLLYYSGHETGRYENYIVDMTDPHAGRTVITFNPTHDYIFRVKMSHPEQISCLYVTSTRNGQTKYIEAKYDEKTGYFVTKDKFDNDVWNYVPGEIGIAFKPSYDHIDHNDPEVVAEEIIDDASEQLDFTNSSVEMISSDDNNLSLQASMPDGAQIGYEYHEYTANEMYAFLLEQGFVSEITYSVTSNSDADELVKKIQDLLKTYLKVYEEEAVKYYLGETDDGNLIAVCLKKTFSDEGDKIFQTWCIKQLKKEYDPGQALVDYVLDPDSMFFDTTKDFRDFSGSVYTAVYDSGTATISYLGRIWELDMQAMGATKEEKERIRETQELLTFVLLSRYVVALATLSFGVAFPGATALIGFGAGLMGSILDSLEEEEDWVRGVENSWIGSIHRFIENLLKWIIDPSGYVYEAVTTNRLQGVTATVYFQNPETGQAVLWDAVEYDQINPIITGPDGSYAWDVPEGLWQVKYELEGYETVYSEWMPVPPPQTDVNVGMVSYAVPEAQWIDVYHDCVELEFSKYMIPDTVDDITLTDAEGNTIAYTLEYSTDETAADGTVYARSYTLDFDSAILEQGEACIISIPESVQSYAGVAVKAVRSELICTKQILILAPETVTVPYGQQTVIPISLSADGFDTIEVVSMFAELATVDSIARTNGGWEITVSGNLPGRTAILVTIPGTNVSKYVELLVDASDGAHNHDYAVQAQTEATCTEPGETVYTCTICGEIRTETIPALGHAFGAWTVILEPTTTEDGLEERSCTRCGHTEERSIQRLSNPFVDVAESKFYYKSVLWAVENGITSGMDATHFAPDAFCTRGQVVTFLWRAAGCPEPTVTTHPFTDVKETAFYYKAMLWAVENGITNGVTATTFGPGNPCDRGTVVTFLWRAKGKPAPTSTGHPFTDVKEGKFYYNAVLWAVENNITSGMSATTFIPGLTCTRGQVVTFLYRAFGNA